MSKKSDLSDMIKNIGYKVNVTLGAGDIGKEVDWNTSVRICGLIGVKYY